MSLVPLLEAFALPCIVKRATPKPTPICKYIQTESALTYKYDVVRYNIPMSIYRCFVLTIH